MSSETAPSEWRGNWPLLFAAGVGLAGTSMTFVSVTLFMRPLHDAFGWSRTEVAAATSIMGFMQMVLSPAIGRAVDRWGARRIGLVGIVALTVAVASLATITSWVWGYWLHWVAIGVAQCMSGALIWMRAVAGRFSKVRAFAMALALTGMSFGNYFFMRVGAWLIDSHGWQFAYPAMAGIFLCVAFPLAWLFLYDTREVASAGRRTIRPAAASDALQGYTLREAMRMPAFWLIAAAMVVAGGAIIGVLVHLIPMFVDDGVSPGKAASIVGLIGVGGLCGKLLVGFLLDRFSPPLIAATVVGLPAISCAILLGDLAQHPTLGLVAVLLLGASSGSEADLLSFLTARYFGLQHFGAIYGVLTRCYYVGSTCSPLLIALVFDKLGAYTIALTTLMATCLIGALLVGALGRSRPHSAAA